MRVSEDILEVEEVEIKLVPLLSNEMVSGGKGVAHGEIVDLLVDHSLSFSLLISSVR